jgi:phosphate-selective porin OprO and OprP
MRQKRLPLLAFVAIAITLPGFPQSSASEVDQLLDLLVAKNVITLTEASEFRASLKKNSSVSSSIVPRTSSVQAPPTERPANGQATAHAALNIGGFVQGRFTEAPGSTNSFEIRRARLIFDGRLTDSIGYQVQLDGVKPQLLDAKVDFTLFHPLRITVGQFKIPFSTESYTSDNLLSFIERSTVVNSFSPGRDNGSNGRDIGIQLSGKMLRFHGTDRVEYFAGVFNGAGINIKDDNHYKDVAARLALRPLKQFAVIGNYYNGATGIKEVGRERADLEINFTQGRISTAVEYIWGHDGLIHRRGWYAQSAYHATRRWEALFRFDKFDPRQHTATLTALNNYVVGTNFFLNPYITLQANYDRQQDLIARRRANVVLLQTQFQFGGERVKQ